MRASAEQLDLLIIGAGPAGLSAADAAAREGLSYLVIERGLIADTVFHYPVGRTVFSTPNELEMREGALHPCREKPTREELLSHYVQFALEQNLRINTEEEARSIERLKHAGFIVQTTRATYKAACVLFAIGAMAYPRRLGVAGEELSKVHHRFVEPYPYVRKRAMVVGGGNSAAEAALFLSEEGAETSLAIWRADWENRDPKKNAIKHWVRAPLEKQIELGNLQLVFFKEIEEIREAYVRLETDEGETVNLPNDVVFVLIGSDADLTLLRQAGVEIVRSGLTDMPVYNEETFETNVRGLYVAGHFTRARHIKEAIAVPRRIVPLIAQSVLRTVTSDE
ncbi:MAG TPA: NAD(P)-binding domain-containing protein [Pyrinomonadaceae bacterium]|jgi:thioredoxin reductase (NADPH)|nr:NAD(P)-binding domain-containing protein [Pyrinomonadaceae bacterium]